MNDPGQGNADSIHGLAKDEGLFSSKNDARKLAKKENSGPYALWLRRCAVTIGIQLSRENAAQGNPGQARRVVSESWWLQPLKAWFPSGKFSRNGIAVMIGQTGAGERHRCAAAQNTDVETCGYAFCAGPCDIHPPSPIAIS